MKALSLRFVWSCSLLITLLLISNGYWLEIYKGIQPCPLCSLQRMTYIALLALFLLGAFIQSKRSGLHFLIASLASIFSALGIWLAGRQVWLQSQPFDKNADCGVSLQYLLKMLPLDKALQKAINGTAECSRVEWSFLHLSLASWSLIFFIVFFGIALSQGFKAIK